MDKFLDRFSNFFVRSFAPSSIFFILLFFNDLFFNESKLFKLLFSFTKELKDIDINLVYLILVLIFLSYGYINQILTQILDNFIKSNYEFCIEDENHNEYKNFRCKVYKKLTLVEKDIFSVIKFNDYNAYQVLGKVLNNNYTYVDDIKSIHTFFLAICFNLFISFSFFHIEFLPLLIALIPISLIIGNLFARNRYMARNKRMYINYLLNKEENQINKGGSR